MKTKKTGPVHVIPCGVAIIRRGREFLIAQRKPDDSFALFWEFPGGKKNEEETFEQCVAREVKEELGIEIRVDKKFMEIRQPYDKRVIWLNFYLCSHLSGEPQAIECQEARWTDLADLRKFNFPPANDLVIGALERLCDEKV